MAFDPRNVTSRQVADSPDVHPEDAIAQPVAADVTNARLPKGIDKPDGELESIDQDGKRVEKRTTM